MVISVLDISSEKITAVLWCFTAACRAMSNASVDFPIPGRAATMIICPGCSPLVRLSRSANPVGTPAACPPAIAIASISSIVGCSNSSSTT